MSEQIKKHPSSAEGKYYVEYGYCLYHELCVEIAPNNFKLAGYDCAYVFKQPDSPEEEAQCREALDACPVQAIRDDG